MGGRGVSRNLARVDIYGGIYGGIYGMYTGNTMGESMGDNQGIPAPLQAEGRLTSVAKNPRAPKLPACPR